MKKNKALTLLLCLVLVLSIAIPSTLALSLDESEPSEGTFVPGETLGNDAEFVDLPDGEPAPEESTEAPAEETPIPEESAEAPAEEETTPEEPAEEPSEEPSQPQELHTGECDGIECAEDCACECHVSLYERLMATKTLDEFWTIFETISAEQMEEITAEQHEHILAHLNEMDVQVEVSEISEPPVESEVVTPGVNYTNVAPFGNPVEG